MYECFKCGLLLNYSLRVPRLFPTEILRNVPFILFPGVSPTFASMSSLLEPSNSTSTLVLLSSALIILYLSNFDNSKAFGWLCQKPTSYRWEHICQCYILSHLYIVVFFHWWVCEPISYPLQMHLINSRFGMMVGSNLRHLILNYVDRNDWKYLSCVVQ